MCCFAVSGSDIRSYIIYIYIYIYKTSLRRNSFFFRSLGFGALPIGLPIGPIAFVFTIYP